MADGRPNLKDLANVCEKRYEILRCRLSKVGFESEDTTGDRNFDVTLLEDQEKEKRLVRTNVSNASGRQNAPFRLQLRRRHSGDSRLNGPKRCAMSMHSSIAELPKLPLRRRASDPASRAISATCQLYQPGKRGSIPEVLPETPEHKALARRLSGSSCCVTTRSRRASSAGTCRDSNWRVKIHKRSINIDDDEDGSYLPKNLSWSSSSSGFSSQSSLF